MACCKGSKIFLPVRQENQYNRAPKTRLFTFFGFRESFSPPPAATLLAGRTQIAANAGGKIPAGLGSEVACPAGSDVAKVGAGTIRRGAAPTDAVNGVQLGWTGLSE